MRSRFLRRRLSRGRYTGTLIVSTSGSMVLKYLPRCVAYSADPEAVGRNAMRLLSRGSWAISFSSISRVSPNENSPPPISTSCATGTARSRWRGFMREAPRFRSFAVPGWPPRNHASTKPTPSLSPHLAHLRAHLARRLHDMNPGGLQRGHLLRCGAFAAADDRAGVTHAEIGRAHV